MIRAAQHHELDEFAAQWARALLSETRQVDELGPFLQIGPKRGHGTHRNFLRHALVAGCIEFIGSENTVVTVLEDDGAVLGWCAWQPATHERPLTIAFVHVADLVRRKGFGSLLLRDALSFRDDRAPRLTCITPSGAALYRAVAAPAPVRDGHAAADRVVEARG